MLTKSQIITFVATSDAAKARAFYADTLGLSFVSDDQFALVFDMNGIMLRIQKVEKVQQQGYTVLGWEVSNIEREIVELANRGVKFSHYEGMNQDKNGIWTAPTGAKIAWFTDPDGNILSLTKFS